MLIIDEYIGADGIEIGNGHEHGAVAVEHGQTLVVEIDLNVELEKLILVDIERVDIVIKADDGITAFGIDGDELTCLVAGQNDEVIAAVGTDDVCIIDVEGIVLIGADDGIALGHGENPIIDRGIGGIDDIADGGLKAVEGREENAD